MRIRRLEQRVEYGNGIVDEWAPYEGKVDTHGWKKEEYTAFVREQNRLAKEQGDNTRLRSVEAEDAFE